MKLSEIISLVGGSIVCGSNNKPDKEVARAFASDLMSDVLTLDTDNVMLITGLTNLQTIRTAEMSDIEVILFVRNKTLSSEILALAQENKMTLIECPLSMYRTCGILFNSGLPAVY